MLNIEGPPWLDMEGWWREPYLEDAGKTLEKDGKKPKGKKHKETPWAYVAIQKKLSL